MTDVSATRSQGSIRVFTEKLPDFQDVNQKSKHGKLSADNTRSSVRSQSRSSARLSAATSGVSSMGHTRNIENWINEKSLRRIHEKHSLEDLDSRKLCATVLRNEETFVRGIDEYLKETKLLQLRRKEILHKQWNENVYEPLRRRVQLKIEEGYPVVDERKRAEYCRYLDYTNRKGNVFLDIMSKDEYNPLSLLHPGSLASLKVRTGRLRDPLLSQERKRIDEERTILRCETGKIFTDNAIRQSWLPELPLRPSGRHGTTCASWLAMSRRYVESPARARSRIKMKGKSTTSLVTFGPSESREDSPTEDVTAPPNDTEKRRISASEEEMEQEEDNDPAATQIITDTEKPNSPHVKFILPPSTEVTEFEAPPEIPKIEID